MFLAASALVLGSVVWRCHDEVYDLALYQGKVVAATSGGALVEGPPHVWKVLGSGGVAPFRKIRAAGVTLEAVDRAGSVYSLNRGQWLPTGVRETLVVDALPSPRVKIRGQAYLSRWGERFFTGPTRLPRDPADGDYALLAVGDRLLAGTPSGIYEFDQGRWTQDTLPSDLPTLRPQGIAFGGSQSVIGGLSGLFVKQGSEWSRASKQPIRQILKSGADVWALYGNGSVDKLDLPHNQMVYDAINAGAKRPWTSCLATFEGTVVFGGQGGWIERTKKGFSEHYFKEIDNDVVMAAAGHGTVRWIGTQKTGLIRYGIGPAKFWNPGNGLTDTWVTALLHTQEGLYVATAGGGLFLVKGDLMTPIQSPTQRPRQLALYKGSLVVGGMDGAWIRGNAGWKPIATNGEETTALVAGERLVVCTVAGVYFLSP